jgi:undecaprenyl-diphosphatase
VIDYRLEHWLNRHAGGHPIPDWIARHVAESQVEVALVVVAVVALGVVSRRWRTAEAGLAALMGAAIALLGNSIVSSIWTRPRPFVSHRVSVHLLVRHAADPSFPSDHSAALAAITVCMLATRRWLGIVFAVWTILVGIARVYVGEHYPGDIVAGWAVGVVAGLLVVWAFRRTRVVEKVFWRVPALRVRGGN